MSNIVISGPVAILSGAAAAVTFTKAGEQETTSNSGSSAVPIEIVNEMKIAPWGEDNQFPQRVIKQMEYYGVGKSALDWKARALYAGGVVPGKITGVDPKTKEEIFEPLDRTQYPEIYKFIEAPWFDRFMLEYLQDWSWFSNCFPEAILSNDASKINKWVHQESSACRLSVMDSKGKMNYVFLSNYWGSSVDQLPKFDGTKNFIPGVKDNRRNNTSLDKTLYSRIRSIDMYNPTESLTAIAKDLKTKKGLKSAILPTNYPSPGKTYYQLAAWDGARLSGWIEIATKIPDMIKILYQKAFKLKYHIEIPESYFTDKYGPEKWAGKTEGEKETAKRELLESMDNFLTGEDSAFKSFVSFFKTDPYKGGDMGQVKITPIEDKSSIDKELLTSSAADIQFLVSAGIHPTLFGAGTIGTGQQRSGGSDIREAFLVYNASLKLERKVMLAPLYLTRDFNGWDKDIQFRIQETVLTTLDKGHGTEKKLS